MEEQVVQKKKSKAPLIILLVLLFLFAVAGSSLGGYLFGKADGEKVESKETTSKELSETEVKEVSKSELSGILYRIDVLSQYLYKDFPITDIKNIDNQHLLSMKEGSYSGTEVENYIKSIVGSNVTVKNENIICTQDNQPLYTFDENGWYHRYEQHPGHGGSTRNVKVFFRSATLEGKTLVVKTNVLYGELRELGGPGDTFYDGIKDDSKKLFSALYEELDAKYEKIKDTLPVTTYTFKRSDYDGFNLESVTIE